MARQVVAEEVQAMFGSIAHRYDLTNTVLSFGVHHYWRFRMMRLVGANPTGIAVDLCTGTGDLLAPLRKRFGKVIGIDFCKPMLDVARQRTANNAGLAQGDALSLPLPDRSVDLVTVSFGVRNFEQLENGLREIGRILKPSGSIIILEFGQPAGFFGVLYRWYSAVLMPFIGGLITGNREAYSYLPETAQAFPAGEKFVSIAARSGLTVKRVVPLTFGLAYLYSFAPLTVQEI